MRGPALGALGGPGLAALRWCAQTHEDPYARERALEALAVSAEQEGRPAAAVDWWRKLAAQDPYNSRVALRLMQSLVAAGERGAEAPVAEQAPFGHVDAALNPPLTWWLVR